jgi:hypothetical protein
MALNGKQSSCDYIKNQLDHDIKLCMVDIMKACNQKLMKKHGYFDLLGCDFMITDDNQLSLLEINTDPALSLGNMLSTVLSLTLMSSLFRVDNKVLEDLLPSVVDGALDLVLQTQGPDITDLGSVQFQQGNPLPADFQLLFDEKNNWFYS